MSSEDYLFSIVGDIEGREASSGYASLTTAEQVFFCVWTVEAEINNGGLEQFYFNSSGDIAQWAPDAFRAIGAGHTATVIERANSLFGSDGPPADRDSRQEAVELLTESDPDRFEELDGAFLEYRDNLSELLATFMRANM